MDFMILKILICKDLLILVASSYPVDLQQTVLLAHNKFASNVQAGVAHCFYGNQNPFSICSANVFRLRRSILPEPSTGMASIL